MGKIIFDDQTQTLPNMKIIFNSPLTASFDKLDLKTIFIMWFLTVLKSCENCQTYL